MKRVTGTEAMMEVLKHYEVEYIFGIPGATEMLFMEALEELPEMKYILGLNEVVCVGMAEGYARAKGKPAFLNLHTGPGLATAMPFLADAKNAGVPLVVTVGQNDSRMLQYEPQLSGNIMGMAQAVSKWCTEVYHTEDIPAVLHRAFKTAMQAPYGPVIISIPQNVMEPSINFEMREATTVYPRIRPDLDALEKAVSLIKKAKNPAIVVEGGVTKSGALEETVRFAEMIGASVHQIWMTDVNFPVNHPQYVGDFDSTGPDMRKMLEECDLVIGIGCSMFYDAFYKGEIIIPADVKFIHIDPDPWELGKNFPINCGIQADIKAALSEFCDELEKELDSDYRSAVEKRIARLKEQNDKAKAELQKKIESEKNNVPVAVSALMDAIKSVITPDTIIVDDSWSSSALLRKILEPSRPNSYLRARGGSIGFGLPGALGINLSLPDKKVLCVSGDGSAAWSMQSLWTAAHYDIPVTYVITNNATYRQVKNVRKMILGDYPLDTKLIGMELDNPVIDFVMLAKSMGVEGYKVTQPEKLKETIKAAMESGKPALVEVFMETPAK